MRFIFLLMACGVLFGQSYNTITIIPRQDDTATGEIRFREKWGSAGGHWVGFRAPPSIPSNLIWNLPDHDGTAGQCLTTNGGGDLNFVDCGTGTPAGLPVPDTTSIVKGSEDATKVMRFEVDGLTAATTRALTVPDADMTLMGLENPQTVTGNKTFNAHIFAGTDSTHDIGAAGTRFSSVYARNVDAAPAGVIGNYTKVRKLEFNDFTGSNVFWDAWASGSGVSDSYWVLRDNAGAEVIKFVRKISGAPADWADVYVDLRPHIAFGQSLGDATHSWDRLYVSGIRSTGSHFPTANAFYDLGEPPNRWRKLWVHDIDLSGAITGTIGNFVTLDTNQTITGQKTFSTMGGIRVNTPVITPHDAPIGEGGEIRYEGTDGSSFWATDVVGNTQFRIYSLVSASTEVLIFNPVGSNVTHLRVQGNIAPFSTLSSNIGTLTEWYSNLYAKQINSSVFGSTGAYIRTQKVDLTDANGTNGLFDIRAFVHPLSGGGAGDRYIEFRDNAGSPLLQMWRQSSGAAVNYSRMYTDLLPGVGLDGSLTLGSVGNRWGSLHIGSINSTGNHTPTANATYDLGVTASRWRQLWVQDINVSGTCTGCGAGVTTVTGTFPIASSGGLAPNITCTECVTTNTLQSITANKAFSGTSHVTFQGGATFQFSSVAFNSTIQSNFAPATPDFYTLGTSSSRWGTVFTRSLNVASGGGGAGVVSDLVPATDNFYYLGAFFARYVQVSAYFGNFKSGVTVNDINGLSTTVVTGGCSMTFTYGVLTSKSGC